MLDSFTVFLDGWTNWGSPRSSMSQQSWTLQPVSSPSCWVKWPVSGFWPLTFPWAECYSESSDHEEAESTEFPPPPYTDQTLQDSGGAPAPPGGTHQVSHAWTPPRGLYVRTEHLTVFFALQGTLPPPYSSAVPAAANGSLSSPVSTMTSHSSSSSLAKQRQSWLDLVSQASTAAVETTVVCSVQVHSHRPPAEEADGELLERSSQPDSLETESNEENFGVEEEEAQTASSEPPEGQAWIPYRLCSCMTLLIFFLMWACTQVFFFFLLSVTFMLNVQRGAFDI